MKKIVDELAEKVKATVRITTSEEHVNQMTRVILNDVFMIMHRNEKITSSDCIQAMDIINNLN